RPKGKAALQSHVLQGLPGIGPQRAARLIQRFGSIEAAIAADVQALAKVEGIGPAIARKLRWTVEEPRGVYARTVGETDTGSKPASASARANADSAPYGIQLQTLCGPGHAGAKRWRALTPFVPPRYLKPNGRNALLGQINAELATRGFPEAVNCKVRDPHDHDDARRARHFRCVRGSGASAPQNLGLVVDLEFANPLPGPIILGYGCHIGLGVFRACE
ncbi:MAG: type I-U CRISPR-associated protein Csb2, partial [Gammaproteobacteria bacterium]